MPTPWWALDLQYGANAASVLSVVAFIVLTVLLVRAGQKQNETGGEQAQISRDQTDILKAQARTAEQQTSITERQARIQELQTFAAERETRAHLYDLFVTALTQAQRVGDRAATVYRLVNEAPTEYAARPWTFDFDRGVFEEAINRAAKAGGGLPWIDAAAKAAEEYETALRELKDASPDDWAAYKSPGTHAQQVAMRLHGLCAEISSRATEQANAINSLDRRLQQLSEAIRGAVSDARESEPLDPSKGDG